MVRRRRNLVILTISIGSVTVKNDDCHKSKSYIFRRHCLHSENENTQSQNTKAKQAYSVAHWVIAQMGFESTPGF